MRCTATMTVVLLAGCVAFSLGRLSGGQQISPDIELQSGPLTPGLALDECPRPIHQVRLLVDNQLKRGTLLMDSNSPEFDEFGSLVGGIQTPQTPGKSGSQQPVQLACTIELVKEGREKWHLYRVSGPKIRTPLAIATRGSINDSGPARLVVHGSDKKVKAVVDLTRYGLAVP